jgi:hypothetical protein
MPYNAAGTLASFGYSSRTACQCSRAGAKARGYLADRSLMPSTQLQFRLGYATGERFALKEHLGQLGIPVPDISRSTSRWARSTPSRSTCIRSTTTLPTCSAGRAETDFG